MATREQGIRRTAAVTAGLAVASVAGTVAIGATAAASTPPKSTPPITPTDLPSGQPSADAPQRGQTTIAPGPDDDGVPDVITIGS
jgi:hypothetical protein